MLPPLPLEGIRVIDLTVAWAGSFGVALLGDLGAEVIKVESLQRWDVSVRSIGDLPAMQAFGGNPRSDSPAWEIGGDFNAVGRNRKSVTIDMTRPEGREVFHRLAEKSDAFIENNSGEVVHRLGIGYDELSKRNPGLIMVSMSGFGATGPYKNYRAYGSSMEAITGHNSMRGHTDSDPTNHTNVFFADACGGASAAFAVLISLNHRLKSGKGQYVDMAQTENVLQTFSQALMDYSMNRRIQTTMGNRHPVRAPQGVYRCAGPRSYVSLSVGSDEEFAALCRLLGNRELTTDPRFADSAGRLENQDELDSLINQWTADKDHYEAFHALQAAGVVAAPVLTIPEVFADPHLRARDMWQQIEHPFAGTHEHMKPGLSHMSKTPLQHYRHAPTLGQDNEYVYKDLLGYSDQEYDWFVEHQHAGTAYLSDRPVV